MKRNEERKMNKKLTRVFLAAILALSVTAAVLTPAIVSVYAATESTVTAAPAPDSPANCQCLKSTLPKDAEKPHPGQH